MTDETPDASRRPAEFAARKQRGKPFVRGQSGNPKGKPKGARNVIARNLDELAAGAGERIVRRLIARASKSDAAAAAVLARIWPTPRGRPVRLKMPLIVSVEDAVTAASSVLQAAATGELTPEEADHFMSLLERQSKLFEAVDLERRIAVLERTTADITRGVEDDDATSP
jgi:hypothetical protein